MINRDEIIRRARAVPQRSDPYSQTTIDPDGANAGYREDCSGWVSYCWGCPKSAPGSWGGYSTSTFVTTDWAPGVKGIMYEIPRSQLQPGDAIGHCTPTSGGNGGHIALWLGKDGSQERILDHGSGWGPIERSVTWGVPGDHWNSAGNIKAFRFRGVESSAPAGAKGDLIMFCKKGDGGPVVEAMQRLGLAAGGSLPKFGPDASYGDETAAMLKALVGGDGATYGPAQYAALMAKLGSHAAGPAVLVPHTHPVSLTGTVSVSGSTSPAKAA